MTVHIANMAAKCAALHCPKTGLIMPKGSIFIPGISAMPGMVAMFDMEFARKSTCVQAIAVMAASAASTIARSRRSRAASAESAFNE
jgi:hypothetical protein